MFILDNEKYHLLANFLKRYFFREASFASPFYALRITQNACNSQKTVFPTHAILGTYLKEKN